MRNHLANLVIDIINRYGFKKPGKWLDIGCNDGFTMSIPKTLGWSTKGIDPSNVIGKYFKELFLKNQYEEKDFINDISLERLLCLRRSLMLFLLSPCFTIFLN